ncbi:MAG TPA: PD-(D/E)XK nuclease family transposase [Oscillatoriales cyanobacterium M59_W2019_021]|nr:MAG: DUF4351 domain-containing protein [Cyanobacteria bacterium J055]HIK33814.1 PD-(D/E)XK nuclease family transposase [Oscillatoriales cyanobacterium M4454_W2019_049]HIK51600.1 PD-(D/E)XK nuclease family transposase [Oscillatoriales cyanobacterium M59_W2019_021]
MAYFLKERYINLLTDLGFKRVFGTEPNKALLIDFLNALLPSQHRLRDVTYKSNENLGNTALDCEVFYDKLKFIYIELPKFTKTLEQLETHLDKWLFLLKHLPDLTDIPPPLQESIFSRLFEVAELANFSPPERDSYENSLKYYRDLNNVVNTSREESREEGRREGTRRVILRLLSRTLGELPSPIPERIDRLSGEQLEALSEALLDFSTLQDLQAWLEEISAEFLEDVDR